MRVYQMKEKYDKLLDFISLETLESKENITEKTCLDTDLDMYGDEASDFIMKYSNEFKVDISNFDFGKYFRQEGDPILFKLLTRIGFEKNVERKGLTVLDLYNGLLNNKLE